MRKQRKGYQREVIQSQRKISNTEKIASAKDVIN